MRADEGSVGAVRYDGPRRGMFGKYALPLAGVALTLGVIGVGLGGFVNYRMNRMTEQIASVETTVGSTATNLETAKGRLNTLEGRLSGIETQRLPALEERVFGPTPAPEQNPVLDAYLSLLVDRAKDGLRVGVDFYRSEGCHRAVFFSELPGGQARRARTFSFKDINSLEELAVEFGVKPDMLIALPSVQQYNCNLNTLPGPSYTVEGAPVVEALTERKGQVIRSLTAEGAEGAESQYLP